MENQSIEKIVRRLAHWHFEIEEGIERIIWFKNGEDRAIHLLEVNRDTFPENKVLVFYHGPTPEYPVGIRLADVTPEEWEKVKKGLIPLPEGWTLSNMEVFERDELALPIRSNHEVETA